MGSEREHVPSEQHQRASGPAPTDEHAPQAIAESAGNRAVTQLLRDAGAVPPATPGAPGGGSSGAGSTPNAPPSQGAGPLDPDTGAAIDSARGGGWTLPDGLRAEIEHHLGVDLRPVRLHTGQQAAALTDSVQAEAFTTGNDIFFGAGRYDPVGRGGRELLAHELTHVAQQATGGVSIQHQDAEVSHPDDAAEVEARGVASRIASALEAPSAPRTQKFDPDALMRPDDPGPAADPDALMRPDAAAPDPDALMRPGAAAPDPDALMRPAAAAPDPDALMRPDGPGAAPDPDGLMDPDGSGPASDPDALMRPDDSGPASDPDGLMRPDDSGSDPDPDGLMRPDGTAPDGPQGTVAVRPDPNDPMPAEEPAADGADASAGRSLRDNVNDLIATAGAMLAGVFAGLGGPAAAPAGPAAGVAAGSTGTAPSQTGPGAAPDAISGASPAAPAPDAISGAAPAAPAAPVPDAISGAAPAGPGPDAISGAGPVQAGAAVQSRADVVRVLTPRPVSVPPPSPHVADPGVAAWKQSTHQRIAGIHPADTRKITSAPARLQDKAKDVQAKNAAAASPDLAADNQKVVPKQPVPEQPLPPPPPDPVPAATELMESAAKLRLPDQPVPQLSRSPQVVDKDYQVSLDGLLPGQLPAPPAAEPAALPTGAPALGPDEPGKRMAQAKESATAPKPAPAGTAAPATPLALTDAGPTAPLSVAPGVQADLTAALAKLTVAVPQSATRIVHAGLAQAFPHDVMLQVAPQLGSKDQPAIEQEMAAELAGIATEAGVAATTLDASVADLRARAATEAGGAQEQLAAEDAAHRAAIGQQAQAQQAQIAGVGDATQKQIDQAVQAGSGQADPAFVDGQAKQLLQKVHTEAETVKANLRLAFEQRQRDLDKWIGGQASAANDTATAQAKRIRDAFEHSSYQPSGDAAAATKQRRDAGVAAATPTITWAHRNQVAATDAGAELKRTAERLRHEQEDQVTQLAGKAATAVQDWRDQRLGEERGWWERQDELVHTWSDQAAADNKIWEQVRDRDTAAHALRDADLISKIRTAVGEQNQAELYKLLSGLDGAQRTVAQICLNGGNVVDALAAGTLSRIAERRVPELAERLRAEALELPKWADLEALGAAQNSEFNATAAAIEVHAGVDGLGTKEEKVYHALGNRTPLQIQAIKLRYAALYGDDLFADVHGDMDVDNDEGKRADALLHSDATGAEIAEFRDHIASVDDLARILRGKTPEQIREFRGRYEKQYDATIEHDISHVLLTPADQARLKALLSGDTAQADAIALGQAVRTKDSDRFDGNEFSFPTAGAGGGPFNNYAGTRSEDNGKAALAVLHQIRDEVDAEAARTGMTSNDRRVELRRRYAEVQAKYGTLLGSSLSEAIRDQLSDDKAGQADALLAGNDWGADAWAMRDELDSYNINYKKVGAAVSHERTLVGQGASRDAEAKFEVEQRTEEWGTDKAEVERRRKAMAGEVDAATDQRSAAVMGAMANVIGEDNMSRLQPTKPQTDEPLIGEMVYAPMLPDPNRDQAAALFAKAGKLSSAEQMDFAIRRHDDDAIKEALKDPAHPGKLRSKAEMTKLRAEYQQQTGRSMDADLDSALSGRAAFDIGLDARGEPADEQETVARLRERQKWEMDNSRSNSFLDYAGAVAGVSPDLRKSMMTPEERALDITVTDAERAAAEVTATKTSGDKEQAKLAEEALTRRVGGVTAAIEDQRRAIDSTAEMAAMIAGIAAGIIVVVASGGSLAPGVMALAAAASTVTSIAVKRTVLGEAYGADQFGKDIALGAIDVAAAVLTAGTANYLLRSSLLAGAVRAGGVARLFATVGAQGIEAGLAGIPHGVADAMMSGALDSDDPLGTLARAAGMSAVTSAAMGGGMAVAHTALHAATGGGVTHAPPPEALGETPQLYEARTMAAKTSAEGVTAEGVINAPDRVVDRPVAAEPSVVVADQGGAGSARPGPAEPARGAAAKTSAEGVTAEGVINAPDRVVDRPVSAEPSVVVADQGGGGSARPAPAGPARGPDGMRVGGAGVGGEAPADGMRIGEARVGGARVGGEPAAEMRVGEGRIGEARVAGEAPAEGMRVGEARVGGARVGGEPAAEGMRVGEARVGDARVGAEVPAEDVRAGGAGPTPEASTRPAEGMGADSPLFSADDLDAHFGNLEGDLAAHNADGATMYTVGGDALTDARFSEQGSELDLRRLTEVNVREGRAPLEPGDVAQPAVPADLPPETWLLDPQRANITDPAAAADANYAPNRTGFTPDVRNAQITAGPAGDGVATPSGAAFGQDRIVGGARGARFDPATGTWEAGSEPYQRPHNPLGQDGNFAPRTADEWHAWEQAQGPLTDQERYALWFYSDDLSGHINPALRGQGAGQLVTDPVAAAAVASDLDRTMQPVPFDTVVYRKTSIGEFSSLNVTDPAQLANLRGATFTQEGYASTSIQAGTWSGSIELVIQVPEGTRGRYLGGETTGAKPTNPLMPGAGSPLASMPGEMEFLVERGTSFTIMDVRPGTPGPNGQPRWTVEVRVAEQGQRPGPLTDPTPLPGEPHDSAAPASEPPQRSDVGDLSGTATAADGPVNVTDQTSGTIGNDTVLPGAEPARPAELSRGQAEQAGGQRVRANEASGTIGNDTVLADPSRGQAERVGGERASANEASGTIKNDAELPQTVEVRNRRVDQWAQNGMPQYYGDGSPMGYTIDAGFDTRTYTNNGQPTTEIAMRVKLVPRPGVTAADIARVQQNALTGVDHVFNSGHVLPNGERMQVKVEFVDKAADAHLVVDLGPGYGRPRQNEWYVDNHPVEVAHELAHQTGLVDEYIDPIALNRADASAPGIHNDSIMSDFFLRDANGNAIGVDMQKATLQQRHIQQIAGDIAAAQAAQATAPTGAGAGTPGPGNAAPAPRAGGGQGNWRPAATTIEQVATLLTERPELLSDQGLRTRYDLLANETAQVLEAYRAGRSTSGERIGSPPELAGQMAELEGLLALQTTEQITTATPIERFLALEELRATMARASETLRSYEHAFTAEVSGDELPGRRPAGQPEPPAEPGAAENRYERSERIADQARGTDVANMPVADIVEMLRFAEPTVTARGIVGEPLERTLPGVGLNSKAPTPSSIAKWNTQPPELAARLAAMFAGYQEAHLIGPGFGGELFQGMALAPDNFNLVAQNQGIENFIRTARDAGVEVPIEVTYKITRLAVPMADGGFEYLDVLTGASYTISRPQSSAPPLQVIFELEEPPSRAWRTVRNDIPAGAPGADVLAAGQRPPP